MPLLSLISDIAKPVSKSMEALSEIRDGSTGEITCLKALSETFSPKCVRTLDRGFDANEYYRYFLKQEEYFVIRAKKNRNVIYNGKTSNIMEAASKYKRQYRMDFKEKSGKTINCKMSCIPVRLCEFPSRELTLVAVYGFRAEPMLLLSSLKMQEKKRLCHIMAKVYLMRWRIEEYFKFKKQQFELEDLRVMSLQSIPFLRSVYPVHRYICENPASSLSILDHSNRFGKQCRRCILCDQYRNSVDG